MCLVEARGQGQDIICKLVRRVVREGILKSRENICKVSAANIGLEDQNLLVEAQIFEHLTPPVQELLAEAKKFQRENDLKFCWVTNFKVYLRESEGTRPIVIKNLSDLENFIIDEIQLLRLRDKYTLMIFNSCLIAYVLVYKILLLCLAHRKNTLIYNAFCHFIMWTIYLFN